MNTAQLIKLFIESPDELIARINTKTHNTLLNPSDYAPHIPFTKADVLAYIKAHNLEREILGFSDRDTVDFMRADDVADGLYLIETTAGFEIQMKERGASYPLMKGPDKEALIAQYRQERESRLPNIEAALSNFIDTRFLMFGISTV